MQFRESSAWLIRIAAAEGASSQDIQAADRQARELYITATRCADFAQLAIARSVKLR
jgi:peptidyl-prolyl cis-trans isomerase SurA